MSTLRPDYGFQRSKSRDRNGWVLNIDENFKIFAWPSGVSILSWELLQGNRGRQIKYGGIPLRPGDDPFAKIIQECELHLTETASVFAHASRKLRTKTGIN